MLKTIQAERLGAEERARQAQRDHDLVVVGLHKTIQELQAGLASRGSRLDQATRELDRAGHAARQQAEDGARTAGLLEQELAQARSRLEAATAAHAAEQATVTRQLADQGRQRTELLLTIDALREEVLQHRSQQVVLPGPDQSSQASGEGASQLTAAHLGDVLAENRGLARKLEVCSQVCMGMCKMPGPRHASDAAPWFPGKASTGIILSNPACSPAAPLKPQPLRWPPLCRVPRTCSAGCWPWRTPWRRRSGTRASNGI